MSSGPATLPLLVEPEDLAVRIGDDGLLVVNVSSRESHQRGHIPGAVHLDYASLARGTPPAPGLLPGPDQLARALGDAGITPDIHVVACDDEGSGRASRLLWTLDVVGHRTRSLLNGGMQAWAAQGHPVESGDTQATPASDYPVRVDETALATRDYVLGHLGDPGVRLLDARSPEEYAGTKVTALRGGHIPGAVNLNWLDTMDRPHSLRLLPPETLREMLSSRGVMPEQEVIVYCQTHHRSAHTYVMLRHLGFPRVRGYAGSWSEWGNDPALPVET